MEFHCLSNVFFNSGVFLNIMIFRCALGFSRWLFTKWYLISDVIRKIIKITDKKKE